jgi:hypothetical protein
MSVPHRYLVAVAGIIGCASGTSGTPGASGVPRTGSSITAEELAVFDFEGKTAHDVIARLRPRWLAPRGVQPLVGESDSTEYALVFVDGHRSGRISALRDIQAHQVGDMRYYDVAQAGAKFGVQSGFSGVIEVRMKSPSRP